MSGLTPDLRALLQAVRDALDVPMADDADDCETEHALRQRRAGDAQIILTAVLRGDQVADCTEQLRNWTADRPVTYTPWAPASEQEADAVSPNDR
jgi:hypothetical protein